MTGPATTAARVLLQALAALGLRDVVLAPGSRSAPLAYAVAEAALPDGVRDPGAPALSLHVRVDERSAAFLALGIARARRAVGDPRPVAVVTTSGTAVANLLPAVLEAHHSGLPLLLLTADRPHELRGTGANQTTQQVGLLAPAVRLTLDVPAPTGRPGEDRDHRHLAVRAVTAALGTRTHDPGPVHLDLAYREPLVPGDETWPAPAAVTRVVGQVVGQVSGPVVGRTAAPAGADRLAAGDDRLAPGEGGLLAGKDRLAPGGRTVVVAGDGAGPQARRLAEANGWPLLAEPSSGACGGDHAIPVYRLLLDHPALGGQVQRVLVLGHPTLSRPVTTLLAREDVERIVIAPQGVDWVDASRTATQVLTDVPEGLLTDVPEALLTGVPGGMPAGAPSDAGWLHRWQGAGAAASAAVAQVLAAEADAGRAVGPAVATAVCGALGPDDVLVLGSSNPVRDVDLVAAWQRPPLVLANRGLAGIDGTVSTAAGVALALGRPVTALLGDLTFLHDVGGLLVGPLESRPDLRLVVVNDDGGSIFATLEHGEGGREGVVERVFGTPHGADLAAVATGLGARHVRARLGDLAAVLAAPLRGVEVVEVRVDRSGRRDLHARLAAAVREAADVATA